MFSFLIKICLGRIHVDKNLNYFLFVTHVGYFLFHVSNGIWSMS